MMLTKKCKSMQICVLCLQLMKIAKSKMKIPCVDCFGRPSVFSAPVVAHDTRSWHAIK